MSLLLLLRSTALQQDPPTPSPGLTEVSLFEETDPQGQFGNYDCYDAAQLDQLHKQQHIDLRSMVGNDIVTTIPMLYLDLLTMDTLASIDMDALEQTTLVRAGERWTNGTCATDPTRKNWSILSVSCTTGDNYTQSVFER